jgi:hypothetical protein
MRARSILLLAAVLCATAADDLGAQVSLKDLPEIARARAERLRPKQVAALEPFWADLSLAYEGNEEFLDRRIREAAALGDSVIPLLLEKLDPRVSGGASEALADNCRRVLERLDPGSFVDALAELVKAPSSAAKLHAVQLLGYARVPQATKVLLDVLGDLEGWRQLYVVRALRRQQARGAAKEVVRLLGSTSRDVRAEVLDFLIAARADQVRASVMQALAAEDTVRLMPRYIDYFARCVRRDDAAARALLPLLEADRLDWQDTLRLIRALATVAPERHEPTRRQMEALIDANDTSSIAVRAAVTLRALGDKGGVTKLKRKLDDKLRRRKREAALYEQRAGLLFETGEFGDAADDYEKTLEYADGAAMTRRAYLGLIKSESRRRKIQNVVKNMKASRMSIGDFEALADQDEPFREAMRHDRVQSYLRQLKKSSDPK